MSAATFGAFGIQESPDEPFPPVHDLDFVEVPDHRRRAVGVGELAFVFGDQQVEVGDFEVCETLVLEREARQPFPGDARFDAFAAELMYVVLPARRMPTTAVTLPGNRTRPKTRRRVSSGRGFRDESVSCSLKVCRKRGRIASATPGIILTRRRILHENLLFRRITCNPRASPRPGFEVGLAARCRRGLFPSAHRAREEPHERSRWSARGQQELFALLQRRRRRCRYDRSRARQARQ